MAASRWTPLTNRATSAPAHGRRGRLRRRSAAVAGAGCLLVAVLTGAARAATNPVVVAIAAAPGGGGWTVTTTGAVVAFGGAPSYGPPAGTQLEEPVVAITSTPNGNGYWLASADGAVYTFGDARFYGSTYGEGSGPIVALAPTSDGGGYWLVASNGQVHSFGDAQYYGPWGGLNVGHPVVGMATVPGSNGYYLVTSDGAVYTFGAARYQGSLGGKPVSAPITGIAVSSATRGYWEVDSEGRTFAFNTPFLGTASGSQVVGISTANPGNGYDEVDSSGVVHTFGSTTTRPASVAPALFPASPFDRSIVNQPVDPAGAGYTANLVTQYQTSYGSVGVNFMPVFTVPASQPTIPVTVKAGCNNFMANVGRVPIPVGAYTTDPSYQNDSDIVVYQPSTATEWELWQAADNGDGTWSACWGGKTSPATSNGVFPTPSGLSATGISYLATLVTEQDIASGTINHTIAMQVARCNGSVAPANRQDCATDPGQPPEGTWFRLAANASMPSGLTPYAQMVFRALQTYGAVVTDQAGAVMIQSETSRDWAETGHSGSDPITTAMSGQPEYSALNGIPWNALQVIVPPGS